MPGVVPGKAVREGLKDEVNAHGRHPERGARACQPRGLSFGLTPARAVQGWPGPSATGQIPANWVLHAAALVAVLRSASGTATPQRVTASGGLLDELLEHEARYWRRTAVAVGLQRDGGVLDAVVAPPILLGAAGTAQMADAVG